MTTFAPQLAVPSRTRPDRTKHVNFTYGMVLGVDDFTQEFAYLSGRDRWIARDLIGYGTVSGLRVTYEPAYDGPARGPRLTVNPGVAVAPSGQLICVTPDQCAYVNEWLAANRQQVEEQLAGSAPSPPSPSSPPGSGEGSLVVYLVLCYAECLLDDRPVPGEPCRSDDDLMAPSRVRDDFVLELRFEPPDQREEDAVRRFVAWLRQIPVADVAPGTLDVADFVNSIRAAARATDAGSPPASPPGSPPGGTPGESTTCPPVTDFMDTAPPSTLVIPRESASEFLRAAFRLWGAELLPCWRAAVPGCGHECGDGVTPVADAECLLLAKLDIAVVRDTVENRLLVGPGGVAVEERLRPFLLDLRLLQEWAFTDPAVQAWSGSPPAGPAPGAPLGPRVVAAGRFDEDGNVPGAPFFQYGGLQVIRRPGGPDAVYDLLFPDYDPTNPGQYIVSGMALTDHDGKAHVLEVMVPDNNLVVRLKRVGTGSNDLFGLQFQITRFGGP